MSMLVTSSHIYNFLISYEMIYNTFLCFRKNYRKFTIVCGGEYALRPSTIGAVVISSIRKIASLISFLKQVQVMSMQSSSYNFSSAVSGVIL